MNKLVIWPHVNTITVSPHGPSLCRFITQHSLFFKGSAFISPPANWLLIRDFWHAARPVLKGEPHSETASDTHTNIARCKHTVYKHARTHTNAHYLTSPHTCFNCPPDTKCNKLLSLNYARRSIIAARTFLPGLTGEETLTCWLKMTYSLKFEHLASKAGQAT